MILFWKPEKIVVAIITFLTFDSERIFPKVVVFKITEIYSNPNKCWIWWIIVWPVVGNGKLSNGKKNDLSWKEWRIKIMGNTKWVDIANKIKIECPGHKIRISWETSVPYYYNRKLYEWF